MSVANERTLSEFLQHSGRLLQELEEGEIVLRRRGGESLVLMTASQRETLHALSRTFLLMIGDDIHAAERVLPWLGLLSAADRALCLAKLRAIAAIALDTGRLGRLTDTLDGWEATALAAWDAQQHRDRAGYDEDAPLTLERPSA
ncbi:MAG: hypothetical protein QOF51_1537 [Chloroflexota bacterium]|jgi:hypothetical protein|nr:hypothetical protein [Chloroflexota bacterium]